MVGMDPWMPMMSHSAAASRPVPLIQLKKGRVLGAVLMLKAGSHEHSHTEVRLAAEIDLDHAKRTLEFKMPGDLTDGPLVQSGDDIIIGSRDYTGPLQKAESLSIVWKQRKIFMRPKDSSTRATFTENGKVTRRQMTIATRYRDKHESLLHLAVELVDYQGQTHIVTFKGLSSDHNSLALAQVGCQVTVTYEPLYLEDSAEVRLDSLSIDWTKSLSVVQSADWTF